MVRANASTVLSATAARHPSAAVGVVLATSHPDDATTAYVEAAARVEERLGFLASQSPAYHPPRTYCGIAWSGVDPRLVQWRSSGVAANSLLVVSADSAAEFRDLYVRYIAPALRSPVAPSLSERMRRCLIALRRASFSAGCCEFSQAYSNAWQSYEVVFGGSEARERGRTIAGRVAVLAIGPDSLRSDDSIIASETNLLEMATAWGADPTVVPEIDGLHELLHEICESSCPAQTARDLYPCLDSDMANALFDYTEAGFEQQIASRSDAEKAALIDSQRDRVRQRLDECYKLRNDIAHGGYDNEEISETMYREIAGLFGSFIVNLAHNCYVARDYNALMAIVDAEATRLLKAPDGELREKAYALWEQRGRPIGDDWADWYQARLELGYN